MELLSTFLGVPGLRAHAVVGEGPGALLLHQYAAVGATSRSALGEAVNLLEQANAACLPILALFSAHFHHVNTLSAFSRTQHYNYKSHAYSSYI